MPGRYQLTPKALDDLDSILSHIAAENADAASRVEAAILNACEMLSRHPLLGSRRPQITSEDVRFWSVTRFRNYEVIYLPKTDPLQVVAVLHAKRNLPHVIRDRGRV